MLGVASMLRDGASSGCCSRAISPATARSSPRSPSPAALCVATLLLIFSARAAALAAALHRAAAVAAVRHVGQRVLESIRQVRRPSRGSSSTCSPARSPSRCFASSRRTIWAAGSASTLPLADLLRVHPADPAGDAAAGHLQRHRDEPGGVRLVLRPGRRAGAGGLRAVGAVRRARHRRQPARRDSLRGRAQRPERRPHDVIAG